MKRIITLAIMVMIMTSCTEKYQPKDIYEEKFVNEYIQTDFGSPSDFIEITKAEYDTVTLDKALEIVDMLRDLFFLFDKENQDKIKEMENEARELKGMVHITFKVREKHDGEYIVNTYFGSYNLDTNECIFGDNENDYHIVPNVMHEIFYFAEDFIEGKNLKKRRTSNY